MAIGLFASVYGHIAAKQVERLLGDAESAPVANGTHHTGIGQSADRALDCIVHCSRCDDFVADRSPLRTIARDSPFVLDRLTGDAVAGESWEPEVGGSGNDTLLAGWQGQVGVALRNHIVAYQQHLTVTPDGEPLHGGDPKLLDGGAAKFIGRCVLGFRKPAVDFVHIAEIALQVPDERDTAVIEMRQIDARAEDSPTTVFWMLDLSAAQHDDLRGIIEQREVNTDFHRVQRAVIFRIQKPRIGEAHNDSAAIAAHRGASELDEPISSELSEQVG